MLFKCILKVAKHLITKIKISSTLETNSAVEELKVTSLCFWGATFLTYTWVNDVKVKHTTK